MPRCPGRAKPAYLAERAARRAFTAGRTESEPRERRYSSDSSLELSCAGETAWNTVWAKRRVEARKEFAVVVIWISSINLLCCL